MEYKFIDKFLNTFKSLSIGSLLDFTRIMWVKIVYRKKDFSLWRDKPNYTKKFFFDRTNLKEWQPLQMEYVYLVQQKIKNQIKIVNNAFQGLKRSFYNIFAILQRFWYKAY